MHILPKKEPASTDGLARTLVRARGWNEWFLAPPIPKKRRFQIFLATVPGSPVLYVDPPPSAHHSLPLPATQAPPYIFLSEHYSQARSADLVPGART